MPITPSLLRTSSAILISCALLLPLPACERQDPKRDDEARTQGELPLEANASTNTKAAAPVNDPMKNPELITNKLGPYFGCINTTRPIVSRHYQRYSARVGGDGRLQRRSKARAPAPIPEPALAACVTALREGPQLTPQLPALEALATTYDERLREYHALARGASEAIKRRDRGAVRDGHEALVAAYNGWDNANIELTNKLDKLQRAADSDYLTRLETRAGRGVEYLSRELVITGRVFTHCLASLNAATGCKEPLSRLARTHDAFTRYTEDHKTLDAAIPGLHEFTRIAAEFLEITTNVSAALKREPDAIAPIAAALTSYGAMVTSSRELDFNNAPEH
jgi:hypothetical protein